MSANLNRAAHTAYFSNLRGTLDALLNVVLVPVPSWGRGLVGWLLWAPPPSVICSQLTFSEISSPSFSWEATAPLHWPGCLTGSSEVKTIGLPLVHGELLIKQQLEAEPSRGIGFANGNPQGWPPEALDHPISPRACARTTLGAREPRYSSS